MNEQALKHKDGIYLYYYYLLMTQVHKKKNHRFKDLLPNQSVYNFAIIITHKLDVFFES